MAVGSSGGRERGGGLGVGAPPPRGVGEEEA